MIRKLRIPKNEIFTLDGMFGYRVPGTLWNLKGVNDSLFTSGELYEFSEASRKRTLRQPQTCEKIVVKTIARKGKGSILA